uniref:EOG090X0CKL n=1 Tax=Scapholeberis mucronata TaxID=202097 RepID=A0A4Y7NMP2_9CRUS|nr:EOG090X0CKL [Scapholeberis mucronata]
MYLLVGTTVAWLSVSSHKFSSQQDVLSSENHDAPKVPHEIYKGTLSSQVKAVKTFSFGTSMLGIGMQPLLYEQVASGENSMPIVIALYSVVGIFTFVTPFLIHFVAKSYVTDITYDPSSTEYTASVYRFFPTKRKITFKLEDVSIPDVPGAFTSFYIKKVPVMCSPADFIYPEHYIKFMGFDKPIDLHLKDPNEKKKDESSSQRSN